MITILELRNSADYQEIVEILKKDKKVLDYYAKMRELGSLDSEERKEMYIECLEYQSQLVDGLRRSMKIKKIIDAKRNETK